MKCWVHKDMDEMRGEVKQGVQEAWDDVTEMDTCTINLKGLKETSGWEVKQEC